MSSELTVFLVVRQSTAGNDVEEGAGIRYRATAGEDIEGFVCAIVRTPMFELPTAL